MNSGAWKFAIVAQDPARPLLARVRAVRPSRSAAKKVRLREGEWVIKTVIPTPGETMDLNYALKSRLWGCE